MSAQIHGTEFEAFVNVLKTFDPSTHDADALLDGQASAALRDLVPLGDRRVLGAFFTPSAHAARLAEPIADATGDLRIVDPSCGAGDLLIAAARYAGGQRARTRRVAVRGVDVVPTFVQAAEARFQILATRSGLDIDANFRCGDGTRAPELSSATHVLTNPPFGATIASSTCTWASGRVHRAATMSISTIELAPAGSVIRAVLPDALRCGTRYKKWRAAIDAQVDVVSTERLGRFDAWTDVDVFILTAEVPNDKSSTSGETQWIPAFDGPTVGDYFDIGVGAVVNNRDPKRGQWTPYLRAKQFPSWSVVSDVPQNRRFLGRLNKTPFVAVPRTSSPSEVHRARAALVADERSIAVDNHLLVATPQSPSLETCAKLIRILRRPSSTDWLNEVNGCRHLTVGALRSVPWIEDA